MSFEWVMPSNHLILCHPLLLPSIFLSIRVLPNESAPLIWWPNCFKNSCVSSHRIKRNTRLTKRSLSHLVNRSARSLKKNKKQPVFHVLISQTLYGAIVLYLEMHAQAREHDSSLQAGPNQGHNRLPRILRKWLWIPGEEMRHLEGKKYFQLKLLCQEQREMHYLEVQVFTLLAKLGHLKAIWTLGGFKWFRNKLKHLQGEEKKGDCNLMENIS